MTDEQPWMSKDLLVRLRWWAFKFCGKGEQENFASDAMSEAGWRIEKLERENDDTALHLYAFASRIEKLEAALREIANMHELSVSDYNGMWWTYQRVARKALEGKDER